MKLIGELDYELAGVKYKFKPTYKVIIEIEEMSGMKCPEILESITKKKFSFKEAVSIIYCALKGGNDGKEILSQEAIFEIVASEGLFKHFRSGLLITSVLTGRPLDDFKIVESADGSASVVVEDKKK